MALQFRGFDGRFCTVSDESGVSNGRGYSTADEQG
jgi:hypothetical protein